MSEYIDDNILDPNEYEHVIFNDGKLYIYNSESDSDEDFYFSVEDWIEQNEDNLHNTFKDLQNFDLGKYATFSDFCEYMHYSTFYTTNTDIHSWTVEAKNYAYKLYGIPNSTIKEFAAHYYHEILDMYTFIERNTGLSVGMVEDFITYLYDYSEHRLI